MNDDCATQCNAQLSRAARAQLTTCHTVTHGRWSHWQQTETQAKVDAQITSRGLMRVAVRTKSRAQVAIRTGSRTKEKTPFQKFAGFSGRVRKYGRTRLNCGSKAMSKVEEEEKRPNQVSTVSWTKTAAGDVHMMIH